MKRKKTLHKVGLVLFLVIGLCFGATQSSLAFTTVYLDLTEPWLDTIGAIEFTIIEPAVADVEDNFTAYFPSGWFDFSGGKLISAFDGSGSASLANGVLGVFDIDVILDSWELTTQDEIVLTFGDNFPIEYTVLFDGTDYTITNAVPIPPALLLFGSGIIGMLGLRRKFNK